MKARWVWIVEKFLEGERSASVLAETSRVLFFFYCLTLMLLFLHPLAEGVTDFAIIQLTLRSQTIFFCRKLQRTPCLGGFESSMVLLVDLKSWNFSVKDFKLNSDSSSRQGNMVGLLMAGSSWGIFLCNSQLLAVDNSEYSLKY